MRASSFALVFVPFLFEQTFYDEVFLSIRDAASLLFQEAYQRKLPSMLVFLALWFIRPSSEAMSTGYWRTTKKIQITPSSSLGAVNLHKSKMMVFVVCMENLASTARLLCWLAAALRSQLSLKRQKPSWQALHLSPISSAKAGKYFWRCSICYCQATSPDSFP